jgi:hypothetical protein
MVYIRVTPVWDQPGGPGRAMAMGKVLMLYGMMMGGVMLTLFTGSIYTTVKNRYATETIARQDAEFWEGQCANATFVQKAGADFYECRRSKQVLMESPFWNTVQYLYLNLKTCGHMNCTEVVSLFLFDWRVIASVLVFTLLSPIMAGHAVRYLAGRLYWLLWDIRTEHTIAVKEHYSPFTDYSTASEPTVVIHPPYRSKAACMPVFSANKED